MSAMSAMSAVELRTSAPVLCPSHDFVGGWRWSLASTGKAYRGGSARLLGGKSQVPSRIFHRSARPLLQMQDEASSCSEFLNLYHQAILSQFQVWRNQSTGPQLPGCPIFFKMGKSLTRRVLKLPFQACCWAQCSQTPKLRWRSVSSSADLPEGRWWINFSSDHKWSGVWRPLKSSVSWFGRYRKLNPKMIKFDPLSNTVE